MKASYISSKGYFAYIVNSCFFDINTSENVCQLKTRATCIETMKSKYKLSVKRDIDQSS